MDNKVQTELEQLAEPSIEANNVGGEMNYTITYTKM